MNQKDLVLMPGADYRDTCDAIRNVTGSTETIKSGQLPKEVARVFSAGESKNEEKWADRFYTAYVHGNGDTDIAVPVPFAPDFVSFGLYDPVALSSPYAYTGFFRDFRTFARQSGQFQERENSTPFSTQLKNDTIENFIRYENGAVTFTAPATFNEKIVWLKKSPYLLIAAKYVDEDKSDAELLREYIAELPDDGGTVTLSNRRFAQTGMTEDDFNAFTQASKPNWTFVFE